MPAIATFRRFVDALNNHDLPAIADLIAVDARVYDPFYPDPLDGRPAILQDYADILHAFPDVEYRVRSVFENGDTLAVEALLLAGDGNPSLRVWSGGAAPVQPTLRLPSSFFIRVDSAGQIVEEHRYYDVGHFVEQLAWPRPPAAVVSNAATGLAVS